MKGRDEIKIVYDNRTKKVLEKSPSYMRAFASDFTNKSSTTRYNYIRAINTFLAYIENEYGFDMSNEDNLKLIKKVHINEYIQSMNKSASFIATQVYAIKFFFNFLEENEYVDNDPAVKVHAPVDKKIHEVVSLTPEEVNTALNYIEKNSIEVKYEIRGTHKRRINPTPEEKIKNNMIIKRNLLLFMMGVTTGMRCSEMISINVEDIDIKNKVIYVTEKGGYERKVYYSQTLTDFLKSYLYYREQFLNGTPCEALYISDGKKRYSYGMAYNTIKRVSKKLNKKITPHKLRSTYATNLYDQTGDIYLVAQGLNHKNIKNTMRYAKPSEEKSRAAADIMGNVFNGIE